MLCSTPLPYSVYNTLPAIESQPPPPANVLRDIGRLFVDHKVNQDVGISLLHKHFELENGEVMVHDGLRCSPASPGGGLEGVSFYLRDSQFQAFEYERAGSLNLSAGFLGDLREFLVQNKLQDRLALSKLDKQHAKLMEHCEDISITESTQATLFKAKPLLKSTRGSKYNISVTRKIIDRFKCHRVGV